jgi:dGTPase
VKFEIRCLDDLDGEKVCEGLLSDSFSRKQTVSKLVNLFVTNVTISENSLYMHPLLRFNARLPEPHASLLKALKGLAYELVIRKAEVQQLERRGQMVVAQLFDTLISDPEHLIPSSSWQDGCIESSTERRICDYVAGMTDSYAERLYKRLFSPGFGSSGDEL